MNKFVIHDFETALNESLPHLQAAEDIFGFVPNLIGILAESPQAAEAYLKLNELFDIEEIESWTVRDFNDVVPVSNLLRHDYELSWNDTGTILTLDQVA